VNYGSGDLVGVAERRNIRRSFDGVRAIFTGHQFRTDAFLKPANLPVGMNRCRAYQMQSISSKRNNRRSPFMKRLLLATDLSPRSGRAMDRASALSEEWDAQLDIIHVVDEELPSPIANRLKRDAEEAIDDRLKALPTSSRGKISRDVVLGSGFRNILIKAEESDTDLIIAGSHREESLADIFLGTTVERVIRRGNDPVLVARDPNGEIYLVHAFDVPFKGSVRSEAIRSGIEAKNEKRMEAMLDDEMQAFLASLSAPPTAVHQDLLEGSVCDVISRQVEKLRPDLLVIGTQGRTGVAHALLGSVAEELLREPPCDVLAVKAW
jgi:nucleotide-binding universal stress UspA family protein